MPGNVELRGKFAAFTDPMATFDDAQIAAYIAAGYELGLVPTGHGGIGQMIVDRGDPSASDYTEATLTLDGTWRDLDLSAIVPSGATWVLIRGDCSATTAAGKTLQLREKGNVNARNIGYAAPQVNGIMVGFEFFIRLDSNRRIQYKITAGMTYVDLTVCGWVL